MKSINANDLLGLMPATALVVASNAPATIREAALEAKSHYGNLVQLCDGVDDQVEIQAALDALPATGGEVKLLDGTYNITATINLDTNQTIKGCGRNTILTTLTAGLIFLSAVGAGGAELTGIVIADMQIDGGAGSVSQYGIYFSFVDYSLIQNVYSRRHAGGAAQRGIHLLNSDYNTIIGNTCQGNGNRGISLTTSCRNIIMNNICQGNSPWGDGIFIQTASDNNTITGNICQGNGESGIYLSPGSNNTITGNTCQGNGSSGIFLDVGSNYNTVSGNTCQGNGSSGISLSTSDNNIVSGNICIANSQTADNTSDNIYLSDADYNLISGNLCRDGGGANQPRYGINISGSTCNRNIIQGNDLYDAGRTANLNNIAPFTIVKPDNREIEITQVRDFAYVKNTSGGALAAGDVVILKSVAAGNEVTTTVTEGDQKVFGMAAGVIGDTAYGYIQVLGKTTALKVNGTVDIAIGDLIGCFTTAKIGMKAASGKMAFAIALEAYAADDSLGVIDALIIVPRQAV